MPPVPFYISLLIYIITAIICCSAIAAINYAAGKLNFSVSKKKYYIIAALVLTVGWLIITSFAALDGMFLDFTSTPPKMLMILVPAILIVIYISSSESINLLLTVIPTAWLVYIQSFRVLMELFLWLMFLQNVIPVQMTFEGLNYDILVGLSAPLVGYYALTVKKWPRIVAVLWNFAGLLLVTNITLISILSTPSPIRQFPGEPANTMVAYFPFIWIPAIIVPFAFLMHVLSLKQLLRYKDI
ncbi:MAG: hypothetical protein K8I03_15920 [Ignavibacteria bacterium]|nr:hypothetical protein [Ignavibacteria bacterium]